MKIKAILESHDAPILLKDRQTWTLVNLHRERERGIDTIERPAHRWGEYLAALRKKGFYIDTVRKAHGGEFSGYHGRYFLRIAVTIEVLG